mmetsp:Transcript_3759/g.14729  ORF Transcript_3759/g.14729 Transcript_3759/m.14729 type:complete len:260 (-) Transcript_3759:2-781(-)
MRVASEALDDVVVRLFEANPKSNVCFQLRIVLQVRMESRKTQLVCFCVFRMHQRDVQEPSLGERQNARHVLAVLDGLHRQAAGYLVVREGFGGAAEGPTRDLVAEQDSRHLAIGLLPLLANELPSASRPHQVSKGLTLCIHLGPSHPPAIVLGLHVAGPTERLSVLKVLVSKPEAQHICLAEGRADADCRRHPQGNPRPARRQALHGQAEAANGPDHAADGRRLPAAALVAALPGPEVSREAWRKGWASKQLKRASEAM